MPESVTVAIYWIPIFQFSGMLWKQITLGRSLLLRVSERAGGFSCQMCVEVVVVVMQHHVFSANVSVVLVTLISERHFQISKKRWFTRDGKIFHTFPAFSPIICSSLLLSQLSCPPWLSDAVATSWSSAASRAR